MSFEKEALPGQEQGNTKANNNNIVSDINKPFDLPGTVPGCYSQYDYPADYLNCLACEFRLPCARASSQEVRYD